MNDRYKAHEDIEEFDQFIIANALADKVIEQCRQVGFLKRGLPYIRGNSSPEVIEAAVAREVLLAQRIYDVYREWTPDPFDFEFFERFYDDGIHD